MIDRSEISGLGLAAIGHAGLLYVLWVMGQGQLVPLRPSPHAIEVTLSDEIALESMSPTPNAEAPAARRADEEAPVEPDSSVTPPDRPEEVARPTPPRPTTAPDATERRRPDRPGANPANQPRPREDRNPRATGRLDGLDLTSPGDRPNNSRSNDQPGEVAGPAVRSALSAELTRKLRPHWRAPTGADADLLRTRIRVELDRNGAIIRMGECTHPPGSITESNRPQVELHCENARRAIRLAAPFNTFPPQFYDAWKVIFPEFDRNLR